MVLASRMAPGSIIASASAKASSTTSICSSSSTPPPCADSGRRRVGRDKAGDLLGEPPGLVKASKAWRRRDELHARLLQASRTAQAAGSSPSSMPAQTSIVQRAVGEIGAEPELLDQQHDPARGIVEQHRRRLAVTVDFVRQRAARAVGLLDFGARARQAKAPLRQHLVGDDSYACRHADRPCPAGRPSPPPSERRTARAGSARRADGRDRGAGSARWRGRWRCRPARRRGFRDGRRPPRPGACRPPAPRCRPAPGRAAARRANGAAGRREIGVSAISGASERQDRAVGGKVVGGRAGRRRHQHAVGDQLGSRTAPSTLDRGAWRPGRSAATATLR